MATNENENDNENENEEEDLLRCDPEALVESFERLNPWGELGLIRVEVYTGTTARDNLRYNTNLRIRIIQVEKGGLTLCIRDVHEDDLRPWLRANNAEFLLAASREPDLLLCLCRHVFVRPGLAGGYEMEFDAVNPETAPIGAFRPSIFGDPSDDEGEEQWSVAI